MDKVNFSPKRRRRRTKASRDRERTSRKTHLPKDFANIPIIQSRNNNDSVSNWLLGPFPSIPPDKFQEPAEITESKSDDRISLKVCGRGTDRSASEITLSYCSSFPTIAASDSFVSDSTCQPDSPSDGTFPNATTNRKTRQKKPIGVRIAKIKDMDFGSDSHLMQYRNPKSTCPSKDCNCYSCYALNMPESADDSSYDEDGRDVFAICWDIKPLPGKSRIRLSYRKALQEGRKLTPEEEFQRLEDIDHEKYLKFVTDYERKMSEARIRESEPVIWNAIFAICGIMYTYTLLGYRKTRPYARIFCNYLIQVWYDLCRKHQFLDDLRTFKKRHSAKVLPYRRTKAYYQDLKRNKSIP